MHLVSEFAYIRVTDFDKKSAKIVELPQDDEKFAINHCVRLDGFLSCFTEIYDKPGDEKIAVVYAEDSHLANYREITVDQIRKALYNWFHTDIAAMMHAECGAPDLSAPGNSSVVKAECVVTYNENLGSVSIMVIIRNDHGDEISRRSMSFLEKADDDIEGWTDDSGIACVSKPSKKFEDVDQKEFEKNYPGLLFENRRKYFNGMTDVGCLAMPEVCVSTLRRSHLNDLSAFINADFTDYMPDIRNPMLIAQTSLKILLRRYAEWSQDQKD